MDRFVAFWMLVGLGSGIAVAGQFTTAIGGSSPVGISALATDSAGDTYIVGSTQLSGTPAFINSAIGAQAHVSVTKLDPNGKVLFTDTFAGAGLDSGTAIAVDPSGDIYIAGSTTSPDYPLIHPLQTQLYSGAPVNGQPATTGFITKISSDGGAILYSTFFGGTAGQSSISALACDSAGNLYLTGYTQASDFPHTPGMPFGALSQSPTVPGAIIASISAAGDKILYSGAIAMAPACLDQGCTDSHGGIENEGAAIALDSSGNVYIGGNAGDASGLPTTPGVLSPNGNGAFVAKFNTGGTGLGYLTYLTAHTGIAPWNTLTAIAVDSAGNVYVGGQTNDPGFPVTTGAFDSAPLTTLGTGFLAKLNPAGSAMVWASYFETPQSIAIDATENVWANGTMALGLLPNRNGWSAEPEFVAALNAAGSQLVYSALYPSGTIGHSLAIDSSGLVHVGGANGFVSAIAPFSATTPQIFAFGPAGFGATARLSPGEVIAIYGPGIGPAVAVVAQPDNGFYPTTLGGAQISINGVNIPLLYAGPNQMNGVVPMGVPIDAASSVRATDGASTTADYPVWIVASTPQSLEVVLNQDGTINSQTNPAKLGSVVSFYATGWQPAFFPLADGQVATIQQDFCRGACIASGLTAPIPFSTVFQFSATVLYGGAAPGLVAGITRFDVRLDGATPALRSATSLNLSVQGPSSAAGPGPGIGVGLWVTP